MTPQMAGFPYRLVRTEEVRRNVFKSPLPSLVSLYFNFPWSPRTCFPSICFVQPIVQSPPKKIYLEWYKKRKSSHSRGRNQWTFNVNIDELLFTQLWLMLTKLPIDKLIKQPIVSPLIKSRRWCPIPRPFLSGSTTPLWKSVSHRLCSSSIILQIFSSVGSKCCDIPCSRQFVVSDIEVKLPSQWVRYVGKQRSRRSPPPADVCFSSCLFKEGKINKVLFWPSITRPSAIDTLFLTAEDVCVHIACVILGYTTWNKVQKIWSDYFQRLSHSL